MGYGKARMGGDKMRQMKKEVSSQFRAMIEDLKEEIQHAEKSEDGLDTTELWGKTAQHYDELNQIFENAEKRYKKNPKKFMD